MSDPEPGNDEGKQGDLLQRAKKNNAGRGIKIARHRPGDVIPPVKSYRMLRLKFTLYGAGGGSVAGFIASLFAPDDLLGEDWLIWCFSLGALIGYFAGYFRAVVIEFKEGLKESS